MGQIVDWEEYEETMTALIEDDEEIVSRADELRILMNWEDEDEVFYEDDDLE